MTERRTVKIDTHQSYNAGHGKSWIATRVPFANLGDGPARVLGHNAVAKRHLHPTPKQVVNDQSKMPRPRIIRMEPRNGDKGARLPDVSFGDDPRVS